MKFILLFLSMVFLLFNSNCSFYNSKVVKLSTNIPVFAAYVEYFNSKQTAFKIQLIFNDEPGNNFQLEKDNPDILIYENLATINLMSIFEPINDLIQPNKISRELIYSNLIETGYYKKNLVLLPLCFSLPMVILNSKSKDSDILSLILPLDTLRSKSLKFKPTDNKKIGFSPFWNDEFIYSTSILFDADYKLGNNNKLIWDKSAIDKSIDFFKTWITEMKGGYEADRQFYSKYINIPPYKLLEQEKILFYFTNSEYINEIPKDKRKNIEFRWLSHNHKIPVNDNITYIGIPKKARFKNEAKEFIKWIFLPSTQVALLKINNNKQISDIFGIANKFSSIIEINEKYIPQNTSFLVGHIPERDFLHFPNQLPDNWKKIKDQIIKLWLNESIITDNNKVDLSNLIN